MIKESSSNNKTRKHESTYTMLAFHQWGFSSGSGDRIPVPAETHQHVSLAILALPDTSSSSSSSLPTWITVITLQWEREASLFLQQRAPGSHAPQLHYDGVLVAITLQRWALIHPILLITDTLQRDLVAFFTLWEGQNFLQILWHWCLKRTIRTT